MHRPPTVVPPPRPPRSPLGYVLVGCAVMGACAGIFGAVAFWLLRVRTPVHAQTPATVPSSNATVDVPPVPVDGTSEHGETQATDEASTPPGTPASSLRARPPWGKLDHVRTGSETVNEYAPQIEKPLEVFMAAASVGNEPFEHALVVCRIQTFAKADTFAGDDLHVRLAVGTTPLVANDGPEDANLAFVSAPLASLKKGELVRFEVYDRDVFSLQPITKPHVTWSGGPITILDAGATIECRVLAGEALGKLALVHAAAADQAIGKVRHAKLDAQSPTWALPVMEIAACERAIGDVAALVGWDDPRTKRRVATNALAVAALETQRPAVFAGLHADAKDTVTSGSVGITKKSLVCGAGKPTCVATVTLRNEGTAAIDPRTAVTLYLANAKSGPQGASFAAAQSVEPGASMELAVAAPATLDLATGPAILGVCRDSRCGVVRLR